MAASTFDGSKLAAWRKNLSGRHADEAADVAVSWADAGTAIRLRTYMDDTTLTGNPRSQCEFHDPGLTNGVEYWVSFKFMYGTAFSAPSWDAVYESYGKPYNGSPPWSFGHHGTTFDIKLNNNNGNAYKVIWSDSQANWARPRSIKFHSLLSTSATTGFLELWIDGVQVRLDPGGRNTLRYMMATLDASNYQSTGTDMELVIQDYHDINGSGWPNPVEVWYGDFRSGPTEASLGSSSTPTPTPASVPTRPTNVRAVQVAGTKRVQITADPATGLIAGDGYQVYRDDVIIAGGGSVGSPLPSPSYEDADPALNVGQTYGYRMSAGQNNRIGPWTDPAVSVTLQATAADVQAPASPARPIAVNVVTSPTPAVGLNWTANTEADLDHYILERATGTGAYSSLANVTGTAYIDAAVVVGTTYSYRLRAVDTSGNISNPGQPLTVPVVTTPAVPTGLATSSPAEGRVALTWTAVAGATAYQVTRNGVVIAAGVPTNSFTDTVAPGDYSYQVAAGVAPNISANSAPVLGTAYGIVGLPASVQIPESSTTTTMTFSITGRGTFTANDDAPWLTVSPSSGTLSDTPLLITLTANPAGQAAGDKTGLIDFTAAPIASNVQQPPVNTAAPTISGTVQVGSTLTGNDGSWSGSPTGYTRKWYRNSQTSATFPVRVDHGMNVFTLRYGAKNEPASTYTFLAGRGATMIRLPVGWEQLQPTLGAALDATMLTKLQTEVARIKAAGLKVILDAAHNFDSGDSRRANLIGSGITQAQYVDYWTRVAQAFVGESAIYAYDLWNEPNTGVNQTAYNNATNAAFAAIRGIDAAKQVHVELFTNWSNASSWSTDGTRAPWITKPGTSTTATFEADGVVYHAHSYPTNGGSWPNNANKTIASDQADWDNWGTRIGQFISWLTTYGQKGYIGETGWANESEGGVTTAEMDAQNARADTIFKQCKNSGVVLGIALWDYTSIFTDSNYMVGYNSAGPDFNNPPGVNAVHRQQEVIVANPSGAVATPGTWEQVGTGATYPLTSADAGFTIRYGVVATNAAGSSPETFSAATAAVATAATAPVNSSAPTISGTAQSGQTLTGTMGTWSQSPTSYAWKWQQETAAGSGTYADIAGASGTSTGAAATFVLTNTQVGLKVRIVVTASNAAGASTAAPSAATAAVAATGAASTVTLARYALQLQGGGSKLILANGASAGSEPKALGVVAYLSDTTDRNHHALALAAASNQTGGRSAYANPVQKAGWYDASGGPKGQTGFPTGKWVYFVATRNNDANGTVRSMFCDLSTGVWSALYTSTTAMAFAAASTGQWVIGNAIPQNTTNPETLDWPGYILAAFAANAYLTQAQIQAPVLSSGGVYYVDPAALQAIPSVEHVWRLDNPGSPIQDLVGTAHELSSGSRAFTATYDAGSAILPLKVN